MHWVPAFVSSKPHIPHCTASLHKLATVISWPRLIYRLQKDNGLARQKRGDVRTVIDTLEKALKCVQPANAVDIKSSSRTDRGVHALCNSVHVDLQHRKEGYEFDPCLLTFAANQMLCHHNESIRVLQTLRVPNDFSSRHRATGRSYIYRIQVQKQPGFSPFSQPYSPLELDRILTVSSPLDMNLVQEAAKRLNGEHDFSAFTTLSALKEKDMQSLVKPMKVVVEPGQISFQEHMDIYNQFYDVWDLKYTSRSYMYHQVRQMTGVILAVGKGLLSPDVVTDMLENPLKYHNYDSPVIQNSVFHIPAVGLYLAKVHYNETDFQIPEEENDKDIKLFNPVEQLRQNEFAYRHVTKTSTFIKIHEKLLDPDSNIVELLLKLYQQGKPSPRLYRKLRNSRILHNV